MLIDHQCQLNLEAGCELFPLLVLLTRMYVALRGVDPASRGSWSLFSVALMAVGGFAVFIALLPD
jgi:hypothetical protein